MSELDKNTIDIVNQLFEKLVRIKPAFKHAWPTEHEFNMVKREWIASFKDNNIHSLNHVKKGYEKLRDAPSAFIPSPGEFVELCKQSHDFLDWRKAYDVAYRIMRKEVLNDFSKDQIEIIKHAIKQSDRHFLKNYSKNQTEPVFKYNYEIAVRDFVNGDLKNTNIAITGKVDHTIAYDEYCKRSKDEKGYCLTIEQWKDIGMPFE